MADIRWWEHETPFGTIRVVAGDGGLRRVELPADHRGAPANAHREVDDEIATELGEYFAGERREFTIPIDLDGVASFRRTVLETLHREVPFGETVSYGELAQLGGRPGAARAVGTAMATNPIAIVVPCHRVLAAGGRIGGYGGGLELKRALLALEGLSV